MALYTYQAFSRDGKKVSGSLDANSLQAVKEHLARQNLFPSTIVLAASSQAGTGIIQWFKSLVGVRVSARDKIFFTKQLAVLLKAGIPLMQALELLIEQTEKGLRSIVVELKDGIKEGQSLADGLSKYPKVFDNTYIQLIRAGEASGRLEVILDRLTTYLERSQELRKKVKGAMTLPLIQLGIVVLVVIGLLAFIVPQIAESFASQGATLPLTTRMLVSTSGFLTTHYLGLLIGLAILIALFFWWKSTASGARLFDKILLKIPIIGYFARMGAVAQFSRTLGMLIESGVNLPESLSIVCAVVDNKILVDALTVARDKIIKQGKIADYLQQTHLFPAVAIYLIRTGEESGKLDAMLLTVGDYYETELKEYADGLAAKLGPIMLVVMGVIVGFVVIAIAGPLTQGSLFEENSLSTNF